MTFTCDEASQPLSGPEQIRCLPTGDSLADDYQLNPYNDCHHPLQAHSMDVVGNNRDIEGGGVHVQTLPKAK